MEVEVNKVKFSSLIYDLLNVHKQHNVGVLYPCKGGMLRVTPQSLAICLSFECPAYRSDTNITAPAGRISISPFVTRIGRTLTSE